MSMNQITNNCFNNESEWFRFVLVFGVDWVQVFHTQIVEMIKLLFTNEVNFSYSYSNGTKYGSSINIYGRCIRSIQLYSKCICIVPYSLLDFDAIPAKYTPILFTKATR